MNWTCLVYGGPILFVLIWWALSARKWFKGPKVNVEHMMLGREEAVVDGQDSKLPNENSSTDEALPSKLP